MLRIFVHDAKNNDDSGPPLGVVTQVSLTRYDWERFNSCVHGGICYPTYEEALADLLEELGLA